MNGEGEIIPPRVRFTIENAEHGGWIVYDGDTPVHAASTASDLCYWLEGVIGRLDVKPESEAALPSFLGKARALITGRAR